MADYWNDGPRDLRVRDPRSKEDIVRDAFHEMKGEGFPSYLTEMYEFRYGESLQEKWDELYPSLIEEVLYEYFCRDGRFPFWHWIAKLPKIQDTWEDLLPKFHAKKEAEAKEAEAQKAQAMERKAKQQIAVKELYFDREIKAVRPLLEEHGFMIIEQKPNAIIVLLDGEEIGVLPASGAGMMHHGKKLIKDWTQ